MLNRSEYIQLRKQISKKNSILHSGPFQMAVTFILVGLALMPWIDQKIPSVLKLTSPLLLAIGMYRSFSLFHEGVHNCLHKNKLLNDTLGILTSPLNLLPFNAWKSSHLQHHQWSGNIQNDPVMGFITIYPKLSPGVKSFLDFTWQHWIPVLAMIQHIVFWSLSAKTTFKENPTLKNISSFVFPILVWSIALNFMPLSMIAGLVVPTLFLYLLGTEVINLPHHLQLDYRFDDTKLPAWEQYRTARSCLYPRWISNLVVLNFNYHIEHHMFPDIPWQKLSEAHDLIKPVLGEKYISENNFSWIKYSRKLSMNEVLAAAKKPYEDLDTVA